MTNPPPAPDTTRSSRPAGKVAALKRGVRPPSRKNLYDPASRIPVPAEISEIALRNRKRGCCAQIPELIASVAAGLRSNPQKGCFDHGGDRSNKVCLSGNIRPLAAYFCWTGMEGLLSMTHFMGLIERCGPPSLRRLVLPH